MEAGLNRHQQQISIVKNCYPLPVIFHKKVSKLLMHSSRYLPQEGLEIVVALFQLSSTRRLPKCFPNIGLYKDEL